MNGKMNGKNIGDPDMPHSPWRMLAEFLERQALKMGAAIICTQEDSDGLVMPEFPEVVSACVRREGSGIRSYETTRIYVQKHLFEQTSAKRLNFWLKHCQENLMPVRCVALVQVGGFRVANVFMPGGRYDDEAVLQASRDASRDAKCWREIRHIRALIVRDVIKQLQPHVLVGDWNANPDAMHEKRYFQEGGGRKYEVLHHNSESDIQAWLAWRHSPFEVAREEGYESAFPRKATTARGHLAVDGFEYKKIYCEPVGKVKRLPVFLRLSDHAAVTCEFQYNGGPILSLKRSTIDRSHLRLARSHTPTREFFGRLSPSTPGLCFRWDKNAYSASMAKTERQASPLEAAMHVTRTVPYQWEQGKEPRTAFTSWTTHILRALMLAYDKWYEGYIWIACPPRWKDLRSETRVNAVNEALQQLSVGVKYGDEGWSYSPESVRANNKSSGIWLDQVLIARRDLPDSHVISLPAKDLFNLPDIQRLVEDAKRRESYRGLNDREALEAERRARDVVWKSIPERSRARFLTEAVCSAAQQGKPSTSSKVHARSRSS